MNNGWMKPGFTTVENLIGVNYNPQRYAEIHRANPGLPMFGSETANNKTARGEYAEDRTNGWASSYNLTDKGWEPVASRQFMCGSFTWTGFDYKGEPNPFGWPDVSNNTGLMDACGFPKDKYYYLESWWSGKPMVHLMPDTWNWPGKEGQDIRVIAFSNARMVEVFLNGRSLGAKTMPQNGHLEWQVPYQPGRLMAKALTNGRVVATGKVETAGPAVRIQLSPDRRILQAGAADTVVVTISILDDQSRLVPNAENRLSFQLDGEGRILGVGNGNPSDHDADRANQRNAFNGHCIAVVQAGLHPGVLKLTASSPGLKSADITFHVH
jgi:beta-galactosidase